MTDVREVETIGTRAITRERIAAAAVQLLDTGGESGLTFRALASQLETGHGAIQWHVPNKAALLQAAAATVLTQAALGDSSDASPQDAIRAIALDVYDAIEAHPWLGAQLAKPPWQDTMLHIFERIGRNVRALGAPADAQFSATSALLNYIIGAGSQEATTSRSPVASLRRRDALDTISARWAELDDDEWAFTRSMAQQLLTHNDRSEFLAGVGLVLNGLVVSSQK